MLTAEKLRATLDYDRSTGKFTWINPKSNRLKPGDFAGSINNLGYVLVTIDWKKYRGHRLAWLHVTGEWPASELDHIDGDRSNNSWLNLRLSDRTMNTLNQIDTGAWRSKSGVRGVVLVPGGYEAKITVYGEARNLGRFNNLSDAKVAYETAKAAALTAATLQRAA